MAIHIDIYAHLNTRKLIIEGEKAKQLADSIERDINRRLEKGAIGRNAKIIASNDRVLDSNDRLIVSADKVTRARNAETAASDDLVRINEEIIETEGKLRRARSPKSIEKWTEALEGLYKAQESGEKRVESTQKARAYAEMAAAKSTRDHTRAKRSAIEVNKAARESAAAEREELQKRTIVQNDALKALQSYNSGFSMNDALLRQQLNTSRSAIDSNIKLAKGFDSAKDSVRDYGREHAKLIDMLGSSKASSSAIEAQTYRVGKAYEHMERRVRDATRSLQTHLVEEAKAATRSPFGKGGRRAPDIEGALARNLGALTPLGTVTPGLLIPLGAAFMAVAQGAVAASQSVLLLPSALSAAGAGFGVAQMATMGLSDAFTAMMDFNNPEKFAESLRLMSPAAQQFVLSIQQLIPTFMEIKNVVQDTFFKGLPEVVNGLVRTYRDSFGSMAVGVSAAFNGMIKAFGDTLQDPAMKAAMATMFDGIVKSFQALVPMIPSLTQLFVQLSAVGMQVLPLVTKDLSDMMANLANFVNNAAASGDLKRWMEEGWAALKALGEVVVYTGKMLYDVFGLHGPQDIQRFKETLFGIVDGFGVFFGTLERFFHNIVGMFKAISDSPVGKVLGFIVDKLGGIENLLAWGGIGLLFVKLGVSAYKMYKLVGDGAAWLSLKIGGLFTAIRASLFGLPAATAAAGTAAGAAAGSAAAGGMAAGAAAAGGGFASKASKVIKGFGWVGLGLTIADLIAQGLRDGKGGMRDALADGLDPGKVLNPDWWLEKLFGKPEPKTGGRYWPTGGPPSPKPPMGSGGDIPTDPSVGNSIGQAFQNPFPGKWGNVPELPLGGFNVPVPNPGGGSTPNIPYGQYSLDSIPLGKFGAAQWTAPDPRSLMSQLTPNQISQANKGYGYVVDPQAVFDAESKLQQQRSAVEEARARVLELQADNQATEQDKIKAQANIVEAERTFIKDQVQLLEAQRGTWKKFNESMSDQTKLLDGLGAEIDADFGISKGLPGIAENIVKFLANITAAPLYGALAAQRGAAGDLGGGKGLLGAAALSGAFGPQYMQPGGASSPVTPGTAMPDVVTTPGMPASAGSGQIPLGTGGYISLSSIKPSLNSGNVDTTGLKPQSMALLSLIQGMPQFAGIPLTSAVKTRENDPFPWHPSGRGLDFGVNAANPAQSALGDQLKSFLEANKQMLGINHVLWKTMQGGDHYNHLHVGLNEGNSPLMSGMGNLIPPAGSSVMSSITGGGLPIPLPVTIVGGGTGGTAGLPTPGSTPLTPPPGTPNAPASNAPLTVPPAGTPGGPAGSTGSMTDGAVTKVWTVNPDGTISWRSSYGNPTAAPKGQPGSPATTPATPTALPSPGQGGPIAWPLPPLSPAPAPAPAPTAPGGLPLAPGGYTPPGVGPSQIGAVVGPPEGTGGGFGGFSGGILGAAQGAIGAAAGAAGAMAGGGGGAAAGALAQIGIEELNRAIAFAGQAAGIGVSGLMETFLPTGGSDLANNNWFTRLVGGVVGMRPLLPNFANISGAANGVQQAQAGNNGQAAQGGNVNVTQNNYNPTGNSATSDLERLGANAAAASMPAMGVR